MLFLRIIIIVVQVGTMKICVTTVEVQEKGKIKNVVRVDVLRKNEF
jgi:hypothetical protein